MFRKIVLQSIVISFTFLSLPMVAFAGGGHGEGNMGSLAIDPMAAAFASSLFVSAVVYAVPSFQVNLLQIAIVALGTVTSVIHFFIGIGGDALLLLNALGYIVLLLALFTPVSPLLAMRPMVRIALLLYTIVTFIAYFMLHSVEQFAAIDIVTKTIEMGLIMLLVVCLRQIRNERQQSLNE